MTPEEKQELPAKLSAMFSFIEGEIEEATGGDPVAFLAAMVLHYGRTRKWMQTMMDLSNAKQEYEMGEFIRQEILKVDEELTFRKDPN